MALNSWLDKKKMNFIVLKKPCQVNPATTKGNNHILIEEAVLTSLSRDGGSTGSPAWREKDHASVHS